VRRINASDHVEQWFFIRQSAAQPIDQKSHEVNRHVHKQSRVKHGNVFVCHTYYYDHTTPQATKKDKIKKSIRSPSIHLAKVGVTILFIVDHMGKERISSYALPNWWKWINYINPVHTSLLQQHQQIGRLIRPHLNTSAAIGWCALRYGWSPRCHGFVNLDPSALEGEAGILISADYLPIYIKFLSSTHNEPSLLKYGVGNIWLEYQTCLLRLNRGSLVMMLDNSVVSHQPEHNNSEKFLWLRLQLKQWRK